MDRIECQWCHSHSSTEQSTCETCGAPLDSRDVVSDSGWREAPRLRNMTQFGFSNSTVQVEGELVPVADVNLAEGDSVFFEHHVMLWKDEQTHVSAMPTGGGARRMLGGMPQILTLAHGPGRVAISKDSPGALVVLPLQAGHEIDVREHAFVVATHSVGYSFVRIKGLANLLYGGSGMYMDRFVTSGESGLLMLHGYGNVFERTLTAGEKIMVEPGGFLYKDASVQMDTVQLPIKTGMLSKGIHVAQMTGPGRVGIQSMYVHHGSE